jgi:hypothetical protein
MIIWQIMVLLELLNLTKKDGKKCRLLLNILYNLLLKPLILFAIVDGV